MELIEVAWFFGGMIMGMISVVLAYRGTEDDHTNYQGQSDIDNDMRIYIPRRSRNRRGDNGYDQQYEAEEIINVLECMTLAISGHERGCINAAIDIIRERGQNDAG